MKSLNLVRRQLIGNVVRLVVFGLVAVLATALIWNTLVNTVSGETHTYTASFSDATGLREGDDVRMAGVRVGRVESVKLVDTHAEVELSVQTAQTVFANTRALIRYQNLVGQRYLALEPGEGRAEPLPDKGNIPVQRTEPSFDLTQLLNGFEPLFDLLKPEDINRLAENVVQVLQGSGPALNTLLAQTAQLTGTVADRDQVLGSVLTNLSAVLDQLSHKGPEFRSLMDSSQRLIEGLNAQSGPIFGSLQRIHNVAGPVSTLLGDIRPDLRADIAKFNQVSGLYLREGPAVESTLNELPDFASSFARISQQGSWLGVYACTLDVAIPPVPSGALPQVMGTQQSEVCR